MKIGHKLTLGFVGLTVLMAALGYICLRTSQATLEQAIGKSSTDLVEQIMNKIDKNIYHRIEEIQVYATDELVKEQILRSNTQFENLSDPNTYIEQVESEWISPGNELTPVMEELNNNELAKELRSRKNFYLNKYGYPLLAELFITNKFGVNVAQTNKTTDYFQADEEWWQRARQDGLFVSGIQYDDSTGTFSYDIGIRIDDANGNFIGVAIAVLNSQEIIDAINKAKASSEYKTTQLCLVNQDAKILYSTKGNDFLSDAKNQLIPRFGHPDKPEHKLYAIGKTTDEKESLFAHTHSKGYKDFKGLDRALLMEIDSAEVFAPIANLRNTLLLAGLTLMGLAILASSITYRSIVIPIAELQNATVQIASGNLDTNLTKPGSGEISQLSNSFQRMAQRLKKTIDDLNDEIDGRKKTEEKLRDNQRFLDSIFDNIQDGICVLDKEFNIVKVNSQMEKMYPGRLPLVGNKCYKVYHDRTSACPWCPSVLALQTGTVHTNIVPYTPGGNQKGWIELSSFPLKNADGNVAGVIEHAKDITVRKSAEDALRESESHFRTILDNILTGIFIIDPETHKIVYANPIATRLTGASQEQLVSSTCHKFICSAEIGQCPLTDLKQKIDNSEHTLLTIKGEKVQIIKTVVPINLGGRMHLLESFVDIGSLKKAETALGKLNKNLETTVEELSRTNKQMQDFVHIAAHDLKTPVRGIGTLADWIISDYGSKLDERGREQVHLLKTRVVRIDKLIEGMLQFSKIVRNKTNEKQVNLNKAVSDAIIKIKPADNFDIAVDSLPNLTCERSHILQVFENLLSNAVAFMDKPNGLIKVGCVEQGNSWKFFVCDNGPGIEQKHFDRIFKIFQTLQNKEDPESTGIGLAIVNKIIELYGGKIWVESQLGKGSTFFFTFPKQQEESVNEPTKTHITC